MTSVEVEEEKSSYDELKGLIEQTASRQNGKDILMEAKSKVLKELFCYSLAVQLGQEEARESMDAAREILALLRHHLGEEV